MKTSQKQERFGTVAMSCQVGALAAMIVSLCIPSDQRSAWLLFAFIMQVASFLLITTAICLLPFDSENYSDHSSKRRWVRPSLRLPPLESQEPLGPLTLDPSPPAGKGEA
jgi:hypothetical protein